MAKTKTPTMSRAQFQLIADVIHAKRTDIYKDLAHGRLCTDLAHDFADALAETNPRFDRSRFLKACGVES